MPRTKTPVSPFPGRAFDVVRDYSGPGIFDTKDNPLGPNGAAVVSYKVPATVGAMVRVAISEYPAGQEGCQRAINASTERLNFIGAGTGYNFSPTYEVVAKDGDKPHRGDLPLTANADIFFNIASFNPKSPLSPVPNAEMRIHVQ